MNKCHFVGKLTSEPEVEKEGGTPVIRFELEVEEFRKDKGGDKKRSVVYRKIRSTRFHYGRRGYSSG